MRPVILLLNATAALLLTSSGCTCSPRAAGDEAGPAERAAAWAAVREAAAQVADPASAEVFRRYYLIAPELDAIERAFPERAELAEAVRAWPEGRKRAAFEWLRDNATWTSQLSALVQESYGRGFEPRAWGPTLSQFDRAIFERRAGLAPLLRDALRDPAIARIAARLAEAREPFTPTGVAERRAKLVAYLRIQDDLPPFAALFDTLLAPGGVNAYLPDGSILFVVGPSVDPAGWSTVLFHEMAHEPVNRVLAKPRAVAALADSACAFASVQNDMGYSTWRSYSAEALVRAISFRLQGLAPFPTDFLFAEELTERLVAWERVSGSFEDEVVSALAALRDRHCP